MGLNNASEKCTARPLLHCFISALCNTLLKTETLTPSSGNRTESLLSSAPGRTADQIRPSEAPIKRPCLYAGASWLRNLKMLFYRVTFFRLELRFH